MDVKIETQRSKEKKDLQSTAKKLSAYLENTGIKQGVLAERIGVSQNTLCRFMGGEKAYVTKSLVERIKKYIEETFKIFIK